MYRPSPCPVCKLAPVTEEMQSGGFRTFCDTRWCSNNLSCFGETEDESKRCWDICLERRDYR